MHGVIFLLYGRAAMHGVINSATRVRLLVLPSAFSLRWFSHAATGPRVNPWARFWTLHRWLCPAPAPLRATKTALCAAHEK